MEYVTLGQTGLTVSQLCFGTWRFGRKSNGTVETNREEAHNLLDTAWERGINFIDTANVYGEPSGTSETYIGEWLKEYDREDFVIASKVYLPYDGRGEAGPNDSGLGRKHIRAQIEGTLERLKTDYLDLYYIHRFDDNTPIEGTVRTLNDLIREGTIHHIGASTMAAWKLTKALWASDVNKLERFEVTQPPFDATYNNVTWYDGFDLDHYLDVCADQKLAVCPYSPLAGGFLTGKYTRDGSAPKGSRGDLIAETFEERYVSETAWAVLDAIRSVADEHDATPAQVALRWLIQQDRFSAVVPIIGARTPAQLEENVGITDFSLSTDQLSHITTARTDQTA